MVFALAAAVTVNVALLAQVTGVALPLLVALVTKQRAPSWLKAALLALLSAVAGVVASAIDHGGTIVIHQALELGLTSWVTGIASYYGFHKPTGLAPALSGVGGIGPESPEVQPPEPVIDAPSPPSTTARTRPARLKPAGRDGGRNP